MGAKYFNYSCLELLIFWTYVSIYVMTLRLVYLAAKCVKRLDIYSVMEFAAQECHIK